MKRKAFTFSDLQIDCQVDTAVHTLDGQAIGAKVRVPRELLDRYPYNASAYTFLQELRQAIYDYGIIEFPGLPVNRSNHTVAMRHPQQHSYSDNPYLNCFCQQPHQDTPPWPTAFWLDRPRRFSATWLMSEQGLQQYSNYCRLQPQHCAEQIHRQLVPVTLANGTGILLNQSPGLMLMDNSENHQLYHARTGNFDAIDSNTDDGIDSPSYAFNEIGLLHHIDTLDSRRGDDDRDPDEREQVRRFMQNENR